MNEHGMENEQSEQQKNSSNIEYLPTKCRVTKPPPPKPALNPLQFIKVQPTPIFHKVKQPTNEIGNIKKERKIIKDEAEDWQANLDNWKSSRRKLQGELIERVVEIKKFEQEDKEKVRRKSKTFNEILEERGKKYSIPIYIEESNDDWSDLDLSNKNTKSCETDDENRLESYDYSKNENYQKNDPYSSSIDCNSNTEKTDTIYSNNDYTIESKSEQDPIPTDETYTYEGAIADYRSRIKPKKDDTTLFKISDMPKSFSEIETFIPKGEIEKRKEFFANQIKDNLSNNTSGRILQDFENSTSIKDRLKSLEKCTDQTVKYVDNVIIKKKVEQITQIFDKTCIKDHNLNKITQINNEKNINILPLRNKENISENDLKEIETQSDDKSSDSFYGCSEDANYPTSISSNDYMVLSSDREDSGIHTADVSSSVSQADDTAEDTISYDVGVNDFQARQKYFKNLEDNNNICCNNILKLTKENLNNQTNTDNINTILNLTSEFLKTNEKITDCDEIQDRFNSNEIRECDIENTQKDISPIIIEEKNLQPITSDSIIDYLREPDSFPVALKTDDDFVFDLNFPLLPTKMIEPPNVKPPPPPIIRDDKSKFKDKDVISTKFTLESSPFGSSKMDDENENVAAAPEEKTKINDLLAEKFYQSDIPATETKEGSTSDASIINMNNCKTSDDDEIGKKEREIIAMIEKAEKHQDEPPVRVERQHNFPPVAQKPTEPIYKHCDYFDDQDSEVLKVEKELQQLEQEELKRKRDSNLFNQGYSRVFTKNTRYSLDNIFDSTSSTLENRKSMPELQYLKNDKEPPKPNVSMFRALNDVDMKYRKSAPNIPGIIHPNSKVSIGNNFQTIENYERNYIPDIQRSAFEVPSRKPILPYKPVSTHNKNRKCIPPTPFNMVRSKTEPSFNKVVNQSVSNTAWLKTRPNLETKSYDQHWLYQEAELRRLQDQKKWQQCKYSSVPSVPNWIIKGPAIQIPESSKTSVRKLSSSKNVEPYAKHNSPIGSPLLSTSTFSEEKQNRILSVSGKKKCSYCGNELGRGAAMIVETLCLFYHMECFKCCVCHIQLGNGLNGTDVRVRNQKLHCRNCYSSDDGVKFSCV